MKYPLLTLILLLFLTVGFKNNNLNIEMVPAEEAELILMPMTKIDLADLRAFKPTTKNWKVVGDVNADRSKDKTMHFKKGTGILLNDQKKNSRGHLFTAFEHGDMELELDVMMPVGSNSGMYFQGRYEVQLLDSWGKEKPEHSDIGGIYQRWDKTQESGKKGFEGHAPKINAAKAPGLWQHFRIVFQAPRFDVNGKKTQNAIFKEVWLNGSLIHKDQEVTGPTRSSAFNDEQLLGPLMIQGDHGPVAFKNMQYKLYDDKKVTFDNVVLQEFENTEELIPNYSALQPLRSIPTDTVSAYMTTGDRVARLLVYKGELVVPNTGEYWVEMKVSGGGAQLAVQNETIINLDGTFNYDQPKFKKLTLTQGKVPFTLVYNKHTANKRGFRLLIQGPKIRKQYLQYTPERFLPKKNTELNANYDIDVENETVLQRGFLMHGKEKKTHTISVGTPQNVHYAYDLASGTLLQTWGGPFLNTAHMWHGRGGQQLEVPLGAPLIFSDVPESAVLEKENSVWPQSNASNESFKQEGYELDGAGNPTFISKLNESEIRSGFIPGANSRALKRVVSVNAKEVIWHKIGEGKSIEKLSKNTYAMDDKNYFLELSDLDGLKPVIRTSNGKSEILVKIPVGKKEINYTIIW